MGISFRLFTNSFDWITTSNFLIHRALTSVAVPQKLFNLWYIRIRRSYLLYTARAYIFFLSRRFNYLHGGYKVLHYEGVSKVLYLTFSNIIVRQYVVKLWKETKFVTFDYEFLMHFKELTCHDIFIPWNGYLEYVTKSQSCEQILWF